MTGSLRRVFIVTQILAVLLSTQIAQAAEYPKPVEGDFVVPNFHFTDGAELPELRIHYLTLGTARKDAQGMVKNAVIIGHGTSGSGSLPVVVIACHASGSLTPGKSLYDVDWCDLCG